jgi:hypothetical protein
MARISKTLLRFGRRRNGGAVQLLQNKYSLPTELWIIILNMAIHGIVSLHEIGAPSDVPQCIYELWSLAKPSCSPDIAYKRKSWPRSNYWRNLRLVCQSWAAIINPRHTPSVHIEDHAHLRGVFDVRTLGICDHSGWDAFRVESPYHKDILLTASTITTVDIYRVPDHTHSMSGFIAYLIANPQYFPNLTSLSIDGYRSLDHRFWSDLEMGYPDLIFLAIVGIATSGAATLSKLKTLHLRVEISESTLTLPSLKHLLISNYTGCMDFIKRQYAIGLESLVV